MWLKENLINLAAEKLCDSWKYICWIDPNVEFTNPNWVFDCIKELKNHKAVQLFKDCQIMHKNNIPSLSIPGMAYKTVMSTFSSTKTKENEYLSNQEPLKGIGWAVTRQTFNQIGGLPDFEIVSGAENLICDAFIGNEITNTKNQNSEYIKLKKEWYKRAKEIMRGSVGYIKNTVKIYDNSEFELGTPQIIPEKSPVTSCKSPLPKMDLELFLENMGFNPNKDLRKNLSGVYRFSENAKELAKKVKDLLTKIDDNKGNEN